MSIFEYDQEKHMKMEREEAWTRGKEEGKEETLLNLVRNGLLTMKDAAVELGVDVEEIEEKLKQSGIEAKG